MKEYTDSSYFFIRLLFKWKFHFIIISVAAIVLSAIFSSEYFIKPKYKSTAIIYPSNIAPYSTESESEQMLQLIDASEVRNGVINKFNLYKHYKIDSSTKNAETALLAEYESNVKISRTQFESIEIEVMDENPTIAKEMAVEIINGLNLKTRNLQREKTQEVLSMYEQQLKFKQNQLDSLDRILQELRAKYQLLDYEIQAEEATKGYLRGISNGIRKEGLKDADMILRNLEQKGGQFYTTSKMYDAILGSYNTTKIEYDNTYKDLMKELTYTNIVVHPRVADKKSYPIRWLIVVTSVISANIILFLSLLFIEKKKEINL